LGPPPGVARGVGRAWGGDGIALRYRCQCVCFYARMYFGACAVWRCARGREGQAGQSVKVSLASRAARLRRGLTAVELYCHSWTQGSDRAVSRGACVMGGFQTTSCLVSWPSFIPCTLFPVPVWCHPCGHTQAPPRVRLVTSWRWWAVRRAMERRPAPHKWSGPPVHPAAPRAAEHLLCSVSDGRVLVLLKPCAERCRPVVCTDH
jgi:hypothetical protein